METPTTRKVDATVRRALLALLVVSIPAFASGGAFAATAKIVKVGAMSDRMDAEQSAVRAHSVATLKVRVQLRADRKRVGMGRCVTLHAVASLPDGTPAAGWLLLPYVNGKRWGAHEFADSDGRAVWQLPLPNPGVAEIVVEARPREAGPTNAGAHPVRALDPRLPDGMPYILVGWRRQGDHPVSPPVRVEVTWRRLAAIPFDPDHEVGAQWCPLFISTAFGWQTAQAVPLIGFYRTWDRDMIRQHVIWLTESGVTFWLIDWINAVLGIPEWEKRGEFAVETMHATTVLLDTLAGMRDEGLPVPKLVLMLGANNGAGTTPKALTDELRWISENYLRNPRFRGLLQEYEGKPLVLIFSGPGPAWMKKNSPAIVDETGFTIRWMSAQHQASHHDALGYWSWMDGSMQQGVSMRKGRAEAMTASIGFFDGTGWTGKTAHGRRGGWTYVESFKNALRVRPRFLQLHQFQEFTGGEEKPGGWYGDSYSTELSDDMEPTSLTTPAYRGDGGWGFHYLNLTRALVDLYRQKTPETTVLAVSHPLQGERVAPDRLRVTWTWVGRPPTGFSLAVNGRVLASGLTGTEAVIDLRGLPDGPATLRLTANGARARYAISSTEDSLPGTKMAPAFLNVPIFVTR